MLYVVATPIGNLEDISLRAIQTLKNCDFVIAENPGYSRRLLQYIDSLNVISASTKGEPESRSLIAREPSALVASGMTNLLNKKQICQFAEHNEKQVVKDLTRRLGKEDGCLITDAGTPGISDPGFRLIRECAANNVQIVPIPGASAAVAALSASGLPTDRFLFLGFLQKTSTKTIAALQAAANAEATAIFYESPERITKTLNYIANAFPESKLVIARELTKIHEEFIRGAPDEVLHELKQKPSIKGEFTILISFK